MGYQAGGKAIQTPPLNKKILNYTEAKLGEDFARYLAIFPLMPGIKGHTGKDGKTKWQYVRDRQGNLIDLDKEYIAKSLILGHPIGLRFDEETLYGIIDLDADSPYHNPKDLGRILEAAEDLGLILVPCQSSFSGGWHLNLIAAVPIPSVDMSRLLKGITKAAGIEAITKGTCEVYPDERNLNQAVRLPGQAGFGFLDSKTGELDHCFDATTPADNISRIVRLFDHRANSLKDIQAALKKIGKPKSKSIKRRGRPRKANKEAIRNLFTPTRGRLPAADELQLCQSLVARYNCKSAKKGRKMFDDTENIYGINHYNKGRQLYIAGLQAKGTRHGALRKVGFFLLFSGITNPDDRQWILEQWLAERNNGLSQDWKTQPQAVKRAIHNMAHWQPRDASANAGRTDNVIDFMEERNRRIWDKNHQAILKAHDNLIQQGRRPTYKAIQEITGLARQTIADHKRETEENRRQQHQGEWGIRPFISIPVALPPTIGADRLAPKGVSTRVLPLKKIPVSAPIGLSLTFGSTSRHQVRGSPPALPPPAVPNWGQTPSSIHHSSSL